MYSHFLFNKQGFRQFDIETWNLKGMSGGRAELQRLIRKNRANFRSKYRMEMINKRRA